MLIFTEKLKTKHIFATLLGIIIWGCTEKVAPIESVSPTEYLHELAEPSDFEQFSSSPPKSNFGQIESIKFIYNFKTNSLYFFNTKKFPNHYQFANTFLGEKKPSRYFFWNQYGGAKARKYFLGTINYYKKNDRYIFNFSAFDLAKCKAVEKTFARLSSSPLLKGKLFFHPTNDRWLKCKNVPIIGADQLKENQTYQALNTGSCVGYLRKVPKKDGELLQYGADDILVLEQLPYDLPLVKGIVSLQFQSVLSHVNILCNNRGTPNMSLNTNDPNEEFKDYWNELVFLSVEANSWTIRKATKEEKRDFKNRDKNRKINWKPLEVNLLDTVLCDSSNRINYPPSDIGSKAWHLFELESIEGIQTPESVFAIPFGFYHRHLGDLPEFSIIDFLKNNPKISNQRKEELLKRLRQAIMGKKLDPNMVQQVKERLEKGGWASYRMRSSTNAEDRIDFSGAGLYESKSVKAPFKKKDIEKTIKKVWSSLWSLNAYLEREYFEIDPKSVAMAVLIHRSFPNELANGVLITTNPYSSNSAFTIHAQYGDISTVKPKPGDQSDQILAYTSNLKNNSFTFEYLAYSNAPELNGKTVFTKEELTLLGKQATIVRDYFSAYYLELGWSNGDELVFDLEFKLDVREGEKTLYIKQARPFRN